MVALHYPRAFGRYTLLAALNCGERGEVALASHDGQLCVVKRLADPSLAERAARLTRFDYPNLVRVLDSGVQRGEPFLVTSLIDGRHLGAVLARLASRQQRLPIPLALFVAHEVLAALTDVHSANLVHGGLDPSKVLLSWAGEVKVLDCGLGHLQVPATALGAHSAPEQALGQPTDALADVWAVGVVLWEMLTGKPLFSEVLDAETRLAALRAPRIETPSHINSDVTTGLDQLVKTALAVQRSERWSSVAALAEALDAERARHDLVDGSALAALMGRVWGDEIGDERKARAALLARGANERESTRPFSRSPTGSSPASGVVLVNAHTTPPPLRRPSQPPPPRRPSSPSAPRPVTTTPRRSLPADPGLNLGPPEYHEHEQMTPVDDATAARAARERHASASIKVPSRPVDRSRTPKIEPAYELPLGAEAYLGQVIGGRYQIDGLLGEGGMGWVFDAQHIEIGKRVALKVLLPQYSHQEDLVQRFRREARAASLIGHPNIVDVTDSGMTDDGNFFFVMERLEGLDLAETLRHEHRVAPERAVHICVQVCRALASAHTAGIIHRDLKPENIFLCRRDENADFVKVLDFGIAKSPEAGQPRRLTTPGLAMGTPEYMAPEQAAGQAADPRADIYSVGAILYELVTGVPPHAGDNVIEILTKKATQKPKPARSINSDVGEALDLVIAQTLAVNPDERPQSMSALEYELNKSLRGRGSAVASMLGLKGESPPSAMWTPASVTAVEPPPSKQAQGFDGAVTTPQGLKDAADLAVLAANQAAAPSTTDEFERRPTGTQPALRPGGRSSLGLVLGGALLLAGGGGGVWLYLRLTTPVVVSPLTPLSPLKTPLKSLPVEVPPTQPDPATSVKPLIEWARRAAEGQRFVAPAGDNLKELLIRIAAVDPGNETAATLRSQAILTMHDKARAGLKQKRYDDAVTAYRMLLEFTPNDPTIKKQLAGTLRDRSIKSLAQKKVAPALADAVAASEFAPEDPEVRITLGDAYMAVGRKDQAAAEYRKVLDSNRSNKKAAKRLQLALKPEKKKRR